MFDISDDLDPIDYIDYDADDEEDECYTKTQEMLDNNKEIFDMYLAGKHPNEIRIYEDLHNFNAHDTFSKLCEYELSISNMCLDLFFDDTKESETYGMETKEEA